LAPLGRGERAALLGRLGLFGVRLSTTLIRQASKAPERCPAELVRRGGLTDLRHVLSTQLAQRRDL